MSHWKSAKFFSFFLPKTRSWVGCGNTICTHHRWSCSDWNPPPPPPPRTPELPTLHALFVSSNTDITLQKSLKWFCFTFPNVSSTMCCHNLKPLTSVFHRLSVQALTSIFCKSFLPVTKVTPTSFQPSKGLGGNFRSFIFRELLILQYPEGLSGIFRSSIFWELLVIKLKTVWAPFMQKALVPIYYRKKGNALGATTIPGFTAGTTVYLKLFHGTFKVCSL